MVERMLFTTEDEKVSKEPFEIPWHANSNGVNWRANVEELHSFINEVYPNIKVLEVSTKSPDEIGRRLSAFNLKAKDYTVEALYQGSKVYGNRGPFTELYRMSPLQGKNYAKDLGLGQYTSFNYFGREYPKDPEGLLYNWVYINALMLNKDLRLQLTQYQGFTDIAFNHHKSSSCQAEALALYQSLLLTGNLQYAIQSVENMAKVAYGKII